MKATTSLVFCNNLPEPARRMNTVKIPNGCRVPSQKQSAIMHRAGMNDASELNNFRTLVSVILFVLTR